MKFFDHQRQAKKETIKLLSVFFLTSVGLSLLMTFIFIFLYNLFLFLFKGGEYIIFTVVINSYNYILLFSIIIMILFFVSTNHLGKLRRGGGAFVANWLNAQLLSTSTVSNEKKAQINRLVEEMAIASGVAVPPIYLLHKKGINAFSAGWSSSDAVIGVTVDFVDKLTYDEMQGIIAHKFSYILNGDIRLNLRLMSALYGLSFFNLVGEKLLVFTLLPNINLSSKKDAIDYEAEDRKNGNLMTLSILIWLFLGGFLICLSGLVIFIIGGLGLIVANRLQLSISQQRQFLADASAVQFTRNPEGIVGALRKIASYDLPFTMVERQASHLFFCSFDAAYKSEQMKSFLIERIQRIKGRDFKVEITPRPYVSKVVHAPLPKEPTLPKKAASQPIQLVDTVILTALPFHELEQHSHHVVGAVAILYATLLPTEPKKRETLGLHFNHQIDPAVAQMLAKIDATVLQLSRAQSFALMCKALPTLKRLSQNQAANVLQMVQFLIEADNNMSLFELCLWQLAKKGLRETPAEPSSKMPMPIAASMVMGVFAYLSPLPSFAYKKACAAAKIEGCPASNPVQSSRNHKEMDAIFDVLMQANFEIKAKILAGCAASVLTDGSITEDESVLLQAFCLAMDVPLPPMQAI